MTPSIHLLYHINQITRHHLSGNINLCLNLYESIVLVRVTVDLRYAEIHYSGPIISEPVYPITDPSYVG
jgi:hypothetical protein